MLLSTMCEMNSRFMREAITLAARGMRRGDGGPFGAVIVQGNRIVGRGWNTVIAQNDPTSHAEVNAIRQACRRLKTFALRDCIIYTTCEPCPMCLAAIHWARLGGLFYGNTRDDAAAIGFDDAAIYDQLRLPLGRRRLSSRQLLRNEAQKLFKHWMMKPDKIHY
jgi:guanine deaminase